MFLGFLGVGRWQICFLDKNEEGTAALSRKVVLCVCLQLLCLQCVDKSWLSELFIFFSSIGHSIVILFMFCNGCALPYQEWSNCTDSTGNKESELVSLGSANLFRSKYAGKPKKLSVMWGSVLLWWDCPEVTEAESSVSISFIFLVLEVWSS